MNHTLPVRRHGYVILGMENIHRMDPQSRHLLKLYCDTGAEALAHMIRRCPFPTLIIACLRTTLYGMHCLCILLYFFFLSWTTTVTT